ncbi:hypothetical protein [Burkholderia gladioli]|uniref:hypothetical protein n=1 Tax=Burkholderia gladioli TaxID=28095 RepID=UPI00163F0624|nr:hypothetical protein [Burkholderia gladioli]
MKDRELLELAAKAAAIEGTYVRVHQTYGDQWVEGIDTGTPVFWNSLTDYGDALLLAVKLRLDIEHGCELDNARYVYVSRHGIELVRDPVGCWEEIEDEDHRAAATCRAITRAAAEIGARITTEDGK